MTRLHLPSFQVKSSWYFLRKWTNVQTVLVLPQTHFSFRITDNGNIKKYQFLLFHNPMKFSVVTLIKNC